MSKLSSSITTSMLLRSSAAVLAVAIAAPAFADAAPAAPSSDAADANVIIVSGYRKSVDDAIRVKKDAVAVVESINAEDVGKLPTNSITDGLSQLPGVTAQRLDGRSDVLAVRGFGPNFTTTLYNGREIATIADDRGFQYDQVPAELVNRADVVKTASADMLAQGVAGTVNMKSIDPLALNKRILSVSAKFEQDGYAKEDPDVTNHGYRATAIYADKFADGTLGVALGGSVTSSPQQERQYQSWGYPTGSQLSPAMAALVPANDYINGGAKYFATGNLETRQSGFAAIEYKPDEKFEMTLDGFYSHYKTVEQQRGLEVPMAWGAGTLVPGSLTISNGMVTQASYSNEYVVQRNNYNSRDAHTGEIGLNLKYHISDTTVFTVDGNYSRAHRHDNNLETYTGTCYNAYNTRAAACQPDTITVTQAPNGIYNLSNTLNYTNTANEVLTDPLGWGYNGTTPVVQSGFLNSPDYVDQIKALRAELQGEFGGGVFKAWKAGVSYSDRTKTAAFKSYFLNPGATTAVTQLPIPASALIGTVNPYGYNGSTLAYDPLAAEAAMTSTFDNRPQSTTRDWVVGEKVLSGYLMATIDTTAGGLPLKGNIGVQVVNTNQSSSGQSAFLASNGSVVYQPVSGGAKYTYALPSATLKLEADHNFFIVGSISRSMSRSEQGYQAIPFTISFNPTTNGNANTINFSGTGGNPSLRPYLSNNIDLSVQKYFANGGGLLSASVFYKDLSNFVDPVGTYVSTLSAAAAQSIAGPNYNLNGNYMVGVTVPNNTGRGFVAGLEVQAELPFSVFSPALSGFGLRLNGTHNISSVSFTNPNGTGAPQSVTVPGLSAWTGVVTGYYEKNGFSLRATYQYRSDFLGLSTTVEQAQSYNITRGEGLLSAQIGYEFKQGPLTGLAITATGSNLTNAPFENYQGYTKLPINYETYGAVYSIGASYKF